MKWFESKIFEIFSENISKRYSAYNRDINKKKIERLMKLNEATNMINILNTKIEILFDKYINNEKIDAFKTLKDDIEELVKDMERTNQEKINEYLKKYEYYFFNNFYLNNKKLYLITYKSLKIDRIYII